MKGAEGIERFRSAVERRLGLRFDDVKLEHLQNVLERRVAAHGGSEARYLGKLERGDFAAEVSHLARSQGSDSSSSTRSSPRGPT